MPYNSPVNQAIAGLGQTIGQAGQNWAQNRQAGAQLGMERERLGATLAEHAAQEPVRQVAILKAQEELKSRRTDGNLASFLGENNDPLNLQLGVKVFGQFGKLLGSKLEVAGPGKIYLKGPDGSRMSEYDISKRIGGLIGITGAMTDRKTFLQGQTDPESVAELARLNAMPELEYRRQELSTRQQAIAAIKAEYPDADLTELKEHIKWARDKYEDAVKEAKTPRKTRTVQEGLQSITQEWTGSQWKEVGRGPKFKPSTTTEEDTRTSLQKEYDRFKENTGYAGSIFDYQKAKKAKDPMEMAMALAMKDVDNYVIEADEMPERAKKYLKVLQDLSGQTAKPVGGQGLDGQIRRPMPGKKAIVRRGTDRNTGRTVIQYEDGSIEYAD